MSELHDEAADIRPSTTSGVRLPRTSAIPRALIILLAAAAVVITVAGVRAVAWLVGPLVLALVVVIAVYPIKTWLVRKGWPALGGHPVVDRGHLRHVGRAGRVPGRLGRANWRRCCPRTPRRPSRWSHR